MKRLAKAASVFSLATILIVLTSSFNDLTEEWRRKPQPQAEEDPDVAARDQRPNAYDRNYDSGPSRNRSSYYYGGSEGDGGGYYYQPNIPYYSPGPAPRRSPEPDYNRSSSYYYNDNGDPGNYYNDPW